MPDSFKLAVLGGSGVATPELIDVLMRAPGRPEVHIALIGRSQAKLELVAAMCKRLAGSASPAIRVESFADPRRGMEGADYVINQVRVGGYAERAYDETFPQEFGIPGEETFGPGGMNMARRTIPVVLALCKAMQEVAPKALLVNLTNPSSMVQYAISQNSSLSVVSICDLPMMAAQTMADVLGVPGRELVVRYTGMNHFGWVTGVRRGGQDLLPLVVEKLTSAPNQPIEGEIVRALGVIPSAYFKYFYHPNRVLAAQAGKRPRAAELLELEAEMQAAYRSEAVSKPASLVKRSAAWYEHIIVPLIMAHWGDTGDVQYLQVQNRGALPFLPAQAIVEVPCVVRKTGLLPLAYDGGLPPDLEALLLKNAAFEMLWVEAIVQKDHGKALRAMLMNHLVGSYDQAKAILDTMWPNAETQ